MHIDTKKKYWRRKKEHQAVHVAVAVRNNIIITKEHFYSFNMNCRILEKKFYHSQQKKKTVKSQRFPIEGNKFYELLQSCSIIGCRHCHCIVSSMRIKKNTFWLAVWAMNFLCGLHWSQFKTFYSFFAFCAPSFPHYSWYW